MRRGEKTQTLCRHLGEGEREMGEREKGMQSDLSEGRDYIENQSQTPTGCC